jgi:hypothetical protein
MNKIKSLLAAALVCSLSVSCTFLSTGCATTASGDRSLLVHVGVSYAVAKVVKGDPERAARIVAIAGTVRQLAGSQEVESVAMLDAFIRSKIDWTKLDAADQVLVNVLLLEVRSVLEKKIGADPITGAKLLVVAEVAGWIEDAAKAALPPK